MTTTLLVAPPADATIPMPVARGHVRALDGIRGLAVLLVMGHHFLMNVTLPATPFHAGDLLLDVCRAGWFGVDLFFVLSGYLITGILLDAKDSPCFIRKFYIRRALRIFPVYFAILAVCTLLIPALWPAADATPRAALPWLWSYTSNFYTARGGWVAGNWFDFSHLWSLAIEEHFYLAWPWVIFFVPRRHLAAMCGGLLLAGIFLRLLFASVYPDDVNGMYLLTPLRCDGLLLGGLLAITHRDRGLAALRQPALVTLWGGALVLLAAIARFGGIPRPSGTAGAWTYTGLAVLFAALLCAAITSPRLNAVFSIPLLRTLGRYSYGLYLFHWLLRPLFLKVMLSPAIAAAIGPGVAMALGILLWVLATVFCVAASWRWLESPCLALKDRWAPT